MLDRLEEAFARQQAFVSDASHELRTPLTAIRGQLEVLARSENPDAAEVRRVQRLVAAEVDRMTRLTEDLLLLAHTDESRFIQREAIELEPLLDDLLASAEPTADRALRASARRLPGILNADRDRVTQALRNLLRNAIEHTQPGGGSSSAPASCPGERVAIWVDDDGPGIRRGRARARLRPLPPRRPGARAHGRRHRPRPRDRARDRRPPTAAASGRRVAARRRPRRDRAARLPAAASLRRMASPALQIPTRSVIAAVAKLIPSAEALCACVLRIVHSPVHISTPIAIRIAPPASTITP